MDGLQGTEFYDDEAVFAKYMATRNEWPDNPNDTLERPLLLESIGDLRGRRILDLGCGDARFGRFALEQGCATYLGVDGSTNMVAAAEGILAGSSGRVMHVSIEEWAFPHEAFDLAVSSLALHYVEQVETIPSGVYRALVGGGKLMFSIEHPVITSCARGWGEGKRANWIVDDYFVEGPRVTSWLGGRVVTFHRTIETYVAAMQKAGFVLDAVRESAPRRNRFTDEGEFERRRRIPLFLFVAGHKPQRP